MKFDVLKELSENYALENTNSSAITEAKHDLNNILEQVQDVSVVQFPVEAVPVFESTKDDGSKVLVVDAYDLGRFMEATMETDALVAIEKIKDANGAIIPDDAKFAILIDKKRLTGLKEAAETNPESGLVNVGHATNLLQDVINKGIELVTAKKEEK